MLEFFPEERERIAACLNDSRQKESEEVKERETSQHFGGEELRATILGELFQPPQPTPF